MALPVRLKLARLVSMALPLGRLPAVVRTLRAV
jgi:hypothetical protein